MHEVALFLQTAAVSRRGNAKEFDQFGRSAFNRYYYSLFLEVRSLIREFNPDWAGAHSQLPRELTGSITKEIKLKRKNFVKRNQTDALPILDLGIQALQGLSNTLSTANVIRVKADYYPEIKITDLGPDRFCLESVSVTDAHNWLSEARHLLGHVRRAWRLAREAA